MLKINLNTMKTNLLKTFFVALFLLSATITKAYDFSVGGICYNIISHNTVEVVSPITIEIIDYSNMNTIELGDRYKGNVSIPTYYNYIPYKKHSLLTWEYSVVIIRTLYCA